MRRLLLPILWALFCTTGHLLAQSGLVKRGDRAIDNLNYPKAERLLQRTIRHDANNAAQAKYARLLCKEGKSAEAIPVFTTLLNDPAADVELKYLHAQALQNVGQWEAARKTYLDYAEKGDYPEDARAKAAFCATMVKHDAKPNGFELKPAAFNSVASEMGAVQCDGGWLVAMNQNRGFVAHPLDPATGKTCYDIYRVQPGGKHGFEKTLLHGKINSRFHDGPCTAPTIDGLIYFTRSNFVKGKYAKDGKGYNHLQVMTAKLRGKKWRDITPLPFNSLDFSCGHPSLSADGQTIYFASDLPNGYGGSDLYVSHKQGESWGKPENLGQAVNSPGNELFPFIHPSGSLYFASDGRAGIGGLDLFASKLSNGVLDEAMNLGTPVNSVADDFAMSWDKNKRSGQLSSNRAGGKGADDVYHFNQKIWIEVEAVNAFDGRPLAGAQVSALGSKGGQQALTTDEKGKAGFYGNGGEDFKIQVKADRHRDAEWIANAVTADEQGILQGKVALKPIPHIVGSVRDDASGMPIGDGRLRCFRGNTQVEIPLDRQGKFAFPVDSGMAYRLVVTKPGYLPDMRIVSTEKMMENYLAELRMKPGEGILIVGDVATMVDAKPLPDIKIRLVDSTESHVARATTSDVDGKFYLVANRSAGQYLLGTHPNYFVARSPLPIDAMAADAIVHLQMVDYKVGEIIKTIYFDYKSFAIKRDFTAELNEIVFFLEDNPGVSLEIGSHTDSRGSSTSNAGLSQERALASKNYILAKNIAAARVTSTGYGESLLVNDCDDTHPCDEDKHAKNRRSEFKVTQIQPK